MDVHRLSQADKYLLYGLLLKKRRSPEEERDVLRIVRGSEDLERKIDALLRLPGHGEEAEQVPEEAERPGEGGRQRALVVDPHPDLTKLLRGSPLRRFLSFHQVESTLRSLPQLRPRKARLVIVNEALSARECVHYFELGRSIQPRIRMIFLAGQALRPEGGPAFRDNTRLLRKPIDVELLERTAQELLASESSSAR